MFAGNIKYLQNAKNRYSSCIVVTCTYLFLAEKKAALQALMFVCVSVSVVNLKFCLILRLTKVSQDFPWLQLLKATQGNLRLRRLGLKDHACSPIKLACRSLSLHAVTKASMQFHTAPYFSA